MRWRWTCLLAGQYALPRVGTGSPLRARYPPIAEHGLIGDPHTFARSSSLTPFGPLLPPARASRSRRSASLSPIADRAFICRPPLSRARVAEPARASPTIVACAGFLPGRAEQRRGSRRISTPSQERFPSANAPIAGDAYRTAGLCSLTVVRCTDINGAVTGRTSPPIWTAVQHRWHRSATVQYWAFCAVPWREDCRAMDIWRGAGAGNPPGLGVQTPAKTGMRTAAGAWCRKAARDQIPG